jgi:HD-GYP domain-containing protein (c-di-GMP phosphodiesterase class II)
MGARTHRRIGTLWLGLAAGVFALAGVWMLVLVVAGRPLFEIREHALAWLLAVLVVGIMALRGWHHDRVATTAALEEREGLSTRADALQAERDAEREAREQAEREQAAERERLEREHADARERLEHDRDVLGTRLRRERDWNRELRSQVIELHREFGGAADAGDIRALVLRVALKLVEAEKGLLLSRADNDGDGRLDLVCALGFDNDPADSEIAQRFAEEVIERDHTIREDEPASGASPADREIESLVAIPIWMQEDFAGVVVCANREGGFEALDDEVLLSLGDHAGAVLENTRMQGEQRATYLATVRMLAEAIEVKDPSLGGHSAEVSHYVDAVARRLELEPSRRERLLFGSLLHDVGKIGISERILLKPGKLTPEEYSLVQLHPKIGYRLVEQVPALREIAPSILYHHERFDGGGYPSGLRGEEIPLEARVICVADSFSAMTAQRPYRPRMALPEACAELERCAGTQFDPEIVRVFIEEVRLRPPEAPPGGSALLDDPELALRRRDDESVLGTDAVALTDNLTLLYARRYFHEAATAEGERARVQDVPFAVAIVDVTGVDAINAADGWAAGDEHLRAVARAVTRVAVRHGASSRAPTTRSRSGSPTSWASSSSRWARRAWRWRRGGRARTARPSSPALAPRS